MTRQIKCVVCERPLTGGLDTYGSWGRETCRKHWGADLPGLDEWGQWDKRAREALLKEQEPPPPGVEIVPLETETPPLVPVAPKPNKTSER